MVSFGHDPARRELISPDDRSLNDWQARFLARSEPNLHRAQAAFQKRRGIRLGGAGRTAPPPGTIPSSGGKKKLFFFVRGGNVRPWWKGGGMPEWMLSAAHFCVHH